MVASVLIISTVAYMTIGLIAGRIASRHVERLNGSHDEAYTIGVATVFIWPLATLILCSSLIWHLIYRKLLGKKKKPKVVTIRVTAPNFFTTLSSSGRLPMPKSPSDLKFLMDYSTKPPPKMPESNYVPQWEDADTPHIEWVDEAQDFI